MVKTRNEVTGIEGTRAAIQTTAAALREKALRELAGHHRPTLKPRKVKAQERAALAILGASHTPLYTIQTFGAGIENIPGLDFPAMVAAVAALSEKLHRIYEATAAAIPATHPARKHLKDASAALENLEESADAFDSASEGETQTRRALRAFGGVILHFVSESGQNMERAERALGEVGPLCGWLAEIGQDGE